MALLTAAPLRSKVAVLPAALPTVTAPVPALAVLPSFNTPRLTVVPPLKVLAPVRVTVPVVVLDTPSVPARMALTEPLRRSKLLLLVSVPLLELIEPPLSVTAATVSE